MGLAIDGNEVHGIARGGQAFVSLGNTNSKDGSINIGGQYYFSKNKMKIKDTGEFYITWLSDLYGDNLYVSPIDVTDNLSNYGGYLAMCVIHDPRDRVSTASQPIIIPTAPTTDNLSFSLDSWSGSLSRTTGNRFTFTPKYKNTDMKVSYTTTGNFYILSNN